MDVFLSYSRNDSPFADESLIALRSAFNEFGELRLKCGFAHARMVDKFSRNAKSDVLGNAGVG